MRKIYIAGPMTGYPELNYPAFASASAWLRSQGHEVVSPAELNPIDTEYRAAMVNDIQALITCDTIYMLKGWHDSKGAKLEWHIAKTLNMEILFGAGAKKQIKEAA